MAVKDHSLDDKIIHSATREFLKFGFTKASLHKIAQNAGITTGALYTRYRNKDALFCSLVENVLSTFRLNSEPIAQLYYQAQAQKDPEKLLAAIRTEEQIYLNLLFDHYEECVLFFCRSAGSSLESMLNHMMEQKAEETVKFLKTIAKEDVNLDGIQIIMTEQFNFYRKILEKGYTREQALCCMNTLDTFLEAGWKDLFHRIL